MSRPMTRLAKSQPSPAEQIRKAQAKAKRESLELHFLRDIRALRLPEPVRNHRFHVERRWAADFAWPDLRLLVEIEGGTRSGGRHVRGDGYENDCEKYNAAAEVGWTVLRYTSGMVKSGHAAHRVGCFIKRCMPTQTIAYLGSGPNGEVA